jgi:hypothetical protein
VSHKEEEWTYGGIRFYQGKRYQAWILPEGGKERLFKASGTFAVGGIYNVNVERRPDGISMIGTPKWVGGGGHVQDRELRADIEAKHAAGMAAYNAHRQEQAAMKEDSVIDDVINATANAIRRAPMNQRVALAAYVIAQINKRIWS